MVWTGGSGLDSSTLPILLATMIYQFHYSDISPSIRAARAGLGLDNQSPTALFALLVLVVLDMP